MVGNSAGAAIAGVNQLKDHLKEGDLVVVLFHDHGSRYVGKMFNDEWMRERGFLDDVLTVKDIIAQKDSKTFYSIEAQQTVKEALKLMKENDISQMPVMKDGAIVGALNENDVLSCLLANPIENSDQTIDKIMVDPFPTVEETLPINKLNLYITKKSPAVIAVDKAGISHIVTKYDIIQAMS
jgi:cystathionine beta-synthase